MSILMPCFLGSPGGKAGAEELDEEAWAYTLELLSEYVLHPYQPILFYILQIEAWGRHLDASGEPAYIPLPEV
jgi:hypothetical protein